MTWRVAKSLLKLREQVNEKYPQRSKASDGTIGDAAHSARTSDHNPDTDGVVKAMDITHDPAHGVDSFKMADELRASGDERIKYIISNRRIWNPSISPAWRQYNGSNPHTAHVHISVKPHASDFDDVAPWEIPMLGKVPSQVIALVTCPTCRGTGKIEKENT